MKKFDYTFREGLPGGPNEIKGSVKGSVSNTGYKRNSPDVDNDFNIIPSPYITMAGVDFPVYGEDNLGNSQMMYPGEDYKFPGDYVTEMPAYGSGGLTQWFAEKWVDVKTGKKCGRSGKDKNGRPYPACRPSRRVNSTTPKTTTEMSAAEKAKFKREKTSKKRIDYNHKLAQFGGRSGDLFQEVDTYIKPGQSIRPNWAQTTDAATNYTFGKNLVDDESRFALGVPGMDIFDEVKYRADAIGSVGVGIGNRKGKNFRPAGENLRAGIRGKASWQGLPGNVLENMLGRRSGVDWRGSLESEAGMAYANGAVRPYMSVTPQTNFNFNDKVSLGVGYEMRGRYDRKKNDPLYGNSDTGTIAPVSQRDAYSGMGRGAGRLSLNYDLGNGDFIEGYYSKPNTLYQGSIAPFKNVMALENDGPRFGVRLRKSFQPGGENNSLSFLPPAGDFRNLDPRLSSGYNSTDATSVNVDVVNPNIVNRSTAQRIQDESTPQTVSRYAEPSTPEKVLNRLANPFTTAGYVVRGQQIPDRVGSKENVFDTAADIVNPAAYIDYGTQAFKDYGEGNVIGGTLNAMGALPFIPGSADDLLRTGKIGQFLDEAGSGFKYKKGFGNPYENLNVTDDLFQGIPHRGSGFFEDADPFIDEVRLFGKELDDAKFDANWISPEHVRFQGNRGGRSVVEVALPGKSKQTQLFYKSSGYGDKAGDGVNGTTQDLWQAYPGHMDILADLKPGQNFAQAKLAIPNWFMKGEGAENVYNSKAFKDVAKRLDDVTKEAGFDLSGQISKYQVGGEQAIPKRNGVRKNSDGSESTHLMATETLDGKNWFSFPTLFQNEDSTWVDMSNKPWIEAYEEAGKRGEVINFGTDKEAAIKFGEGSWKKQVGGQQGPPQLTPGPIQDKVYPVSTGPTEDSLENRIINAKSSTPKSNVLDLNNTLDYLVDTRGNTKDFWGNTADTIAYHESWHTMNPKMKQADDGPARGMFQFEGPAFKTFQTRYKTVADTLGLETDDDILKATSADQLTPKQQYTAFLVNLIESEAVLKDYADGKMSIEDLWLTGHKNVEAKGDRRSFKTSVDKSKVKGITGGYAELKKQGGEKDKTPPSIDPSLLNPALTARLSQIGSQPTMQAAQPAVPAFTQEDQVKLRQTLLDSNNPSETSAYNPVVYQGPGDYISSDEFNVSEKLANTSYEAPDVTQTYVDNVNSQMGYDLQDLNKKYYKKYTSSNKPDVLEIQEDLVNKGFLTNSMLDGMYGPKTQKAVKAYNDSLNKLKINSDLIPAKLDDTRCASGMCSVLEDQGVNTTSLGLKYKDAWNILESTNKSGNAATVYNIYDQPEFSNVKSTSDIKNATRSVKRRSQTTADMYQVGDIVGIYFPSSTHHSETIGSKTNNTHVGFVSAIDEKGQPVISHNVGGDLRQDRWDNLVTGWISRPNNVSQVRVKYDAQNWQDVEVPESVISNFESKIERPLTDQENSNVIKVIKRVSYNSQTLPEKLGSSVDPEWLKESVTGILGNETALGLNVKRTRKEIADADPVRAAAYAVKGVEDEDISLGMGKVKYSSLDPFSKQFFDITSSKDLGDDNKNIDVTTYNMIKHYDMFKNYSSQFPELGLTEDDIRNMSILSHNQGTGKLLKLGRNADFQTVKQEVRKLRELYDSESNDISSTNYRYIRSLGNLFGPTAANIADSLGRGLYNLDNTITGKTSGYESYISKANRYGDWVYNKDDDTKYPTLYDFMKDKGVSPNYKNRERIYKEFFKEDYSGSVSENNKLLKFLSLMNPQGSEFASIMGLV